MAAENEFPKIDGDVLFASEVNAFLNPIKVIYTGSGFNSTISSSGTDEQSHELTSISAADLNQATYLKISSLVNTSSSSANDGDASIKFQTQNLSDLTYSDSMSYRVVAHNNTGQSGGNSSPTIYIEWIHTVTANEKINAIQVKVFSKSVNNSTGQVQVGNIQTRLELA